MVATNSTSKTKRPAARPRVKACEPAPAYGLPDGPTSFRHGLRARERGVLDRALEIVGRGLREREVFATPDAVIGCIRHYLDKCGPTQHLLGNLLVEVDGDHATSQCYVSDMHLGTGDKAHVTFSTLGDYHDQWRRMLDVHLDGGFHLAQPAYRAMRSAGRGGRFVFVSSSAGMFGQPMEAHYAAAKAGLVGLMNVLAIEGEAHGILANAVLPTGFSRMVTETVGDEKFLAESGFMRAIRPELVVPLVTFLASRACTVTHRSYSAGAGRYARVFVGLGHGWLAEPDHTPSAEDIADRLAEISGTERFRVPASIVDEVLEVCDRRGISAMPGGAPVSFPEPSAADR